MHLNLEYPNLADVDLGFHSRCIHIQGKESPQHNILLDVPVTKSTEKFKLKKILSITEQLSNLKKRKLLY